MGSTIAFIGLGAMGLPMATNLAKAGHEVLGFDVDDNRVARARECGIAPARSVSESAEGADVLLAMLPTDVAVRHVLLATDGALARLRRGSVVINCSTTDIAISREIAAMGCERGVDVLDAPVTGSVSAATDGVLTFLVGGSPDVLKGVDSLLKVMGSRALHCGDAGSGQIAWACNQLVFASNLVAVSEAFTLAARSGVAAQKLLDALSVSSGNSWALNNFCPVPGLVGFAPANYDYRPRLSAPRLAADLRLAQAAADLAGMPLRVAAAARHLVERLAAGSPELDCSAVIKVIGTA
jgi:3-hydroxyisobutyrate dehydrogenase